MPSEQAYEVNRSGLGLPMRPSDVLRDVMARHGLTVEALAAALHVSERRVHDVSVGEAGIDVDLAARLGRHFGNGGVFWATLGPLYSLSLCEKTYGAKFDAEVKPAAKNGPTVYTIDDMPDEVVEQIAAARYGVASG